MFDTYGKHGLYLVTLSGCLPGVSLVSRVEGANEVLQRMGGQNGDAVAQAANERTLFDNHGAM
jgi:hypothetical protein